MKNDLSSHKCHRITSKYMLKNWESLKFFLFLSNKFCS